VNVQRSALAFMLSAVGLSSTHHGMWVAIEPPVGHLFQIESEMAAAGSKVEIKWVLHLLPNSIAECPRQFNHWSAPTEHPPHLTGPGTSRPATLDWTGHLSTHHTWLDWAPLDPPHSSALPTLTTR
jgi:hypothetical protein